MKKVIMCGNHPSSKGGMTSVIHLIRQHDWKNEGIALSFISTFLPGNRAKKILFFAIAYLRIAFRMIFNRPDAVHIHMSDRGSFLRARAIQLLCKIFHVNDIIHIHSAVFETWYDSLTDKNCQQVRSFLRKAALVIALGEKMEKMLRNIELSAKLTALNNCVIIPKATAKWNDEKTEILFLGVLTKRKGVWDLLDAIKLLADHDKIGKLHFTIAGTGEEEANLKKKADELGIAASVSFVGWIDQRKKEQMLEQCQIMVLPSYGEGLPISVLEALSYGMPVVSTDVGDTSVAVKDQVNGRLVKPGDIEALAEALLYASEKETYLKLSIQAKKIAAEQFSVEYFYQRLREIYCSFDLVCQ